ncbi:MAG: 5'-nucleotidase [Bacteroidota bacterium]|nr:hypothetical protein [Christiangramia sp.]MEE2771077.1 5'-nucleotidase [Bacteroidota bacterium]
MKSFIRLLLVISLFSSCKNNPTTISSFEGKRIPIDSQLSENEEINDFIAPYKENLDKTMDSVLAYNPKLLTKSDGDLNTAIGNFMADAVMEQVNPVFQSRTGKEIDFVLLNNGGIRAQLPSGGLTMKKIYELMPFENEIVIVELTGKDVKDMLQYLSKAKTAHPVSGIELRADRNYKIYKASIDGQPIDENKHYFVATSDYLQQGGDNMNFFANPVEVYSVDYKIRNALIDYLKKTDTLRAKIDNRYIRE